jgi:hypothetical protein
VKMKVKLAKARALQCGSKNLRQKKKAAAFLPALPTLSNALPSSSSQATAVSSIPVKFIIEPWAADPLPTSTLFQSLRNCIVTLPTSVPLASKADLLARFSGDPTLEVEVGEDPWESLDPALNSAIGYGASVGEIARIIRRGNYGMDGMYQWLVKCVVELKVNEGLRDENPTSYRCDGITVRRVLSF